MGPLREVLDGYSLSARRQLPGFTSAQKKNDLTSLSIALAYCKYRTLGLLQCKKNSTPYNPWTPLYTSKADSQEIPFLLRTKLNNGVIVDRDGR